MVLSSHRICYRKDHWGRKTATLCKGRKRPGSVYIPTCPRVNLLGQVRVAEGSDGCGDCDVVALLGAVW
ncbi:hypothetical protein E2C01_093119 [Portunus trituberculatus]|uniref:Uncharacterized protein n=1 Tax=Portunus trituberculatus TaxID=210409 RepID=A0A5B7JXA3_PORTR|nr:hypothetical protein [Portunus trituberculatus]